MINDASVVIGGGNWGIKEADVLGYKLINDEYYARDIDFANSTAAGTYTDSTGVIRKAPYNLLQYSEQFDNGVWTKGNSSVTSNAAVSPNGFTNASKIIPNTTSGAHNIYQSVNVSATPYTLSFYAKKDGYTGIRVADLATGVGARFNLLNGSLGIVSSGVIASIQSLANDWYRCSITFTPTAGTQLYGCYVDQSVNVSSYSGDGTSGIFVWGAQLVEGTEALPYFPTTTRLNVPRIDYRNADGSLSTVGRLLLEPQRTNSIRNSSMVGAVAGTPGTTPNNWVLSTVGLDQTVVGTGTENGVPYIDFRFNGTASATNLTIGFESVTGIVASNGQTWSNSFYSKVIAQPNPPLSYNVNIVERTSAGSFLVEGNALMSLTSSLSRFSFVRTLSGGATVERVQSRMLVLLVTGQTYDFTIRIAAPQMELGAYATTWIPTTTATVTRNADVASRTGVSSWIGQTQGTLFTEVDFTQTGTEVYILSLGSAGVDTISIRRLTSGEIRCALTAATSSGTTNASSAALPNGRYKLAYKYSSGSIKLFINGALSFTLTPTFTFGSALSSLLLGMTTASTGQLSDRLSQSILFPTSLTDDQCIQLTTL